MIREGQIVLFRFPPTDQTAAKLRPALVLRRAPGPFDDWLVSMVSSQLEQEIPAFDEVLTHNAPDFAGSGLKVPSVIRLARLAMAERSVLRGAIGQIAPDRLQRIKPSWRNGSPVPEREPKLVSPSDETTFLTEPWPLQCACAL